MKKDYTFLLGNPHSDINSISDSDKQYMPEKYNSAHARAGFSKKLLLFLLYSPYGDSRTLICIII